MLFDYLKKHWQGKLPLPISLWVNIVLPTVFLLTLQTLWVDEQVARGFLPAWPVVIVLTLIYAILLIWQVAGITRCLRSGHGGALLNDPLLINACIVLTIVYLIIRQLDLLTSENSFGKPRPLPGSGLKPIVTTPTLSLHATDSTRMMSNGAIGTGATRVLREFLNQNPQVRSVSLDSDGGNVFEARGMGKTVKEYSLNTHVDSQCYSACTLIFVNGVQRSAGKNARFGFHAYRMDARYPDVYFDVQAQQKRDAALFSTNGVALEFVNRIYQSESSQLWIPTRAELLNARYLTTGENSGNLIF